MLHFKLIVILNLSRVTMLKPIRILACTMQKRDIGSQPLLRGPQELLQKLKFSTFYAKASYFGVLFAKLFKYFYIIIINVWLNLTFIVMVILNSNSELCRL